MKTASTFRIVLVTAPDMKVARHLTKVALRLKLAACANLVPRIESHYWWKGKIETGAEVMMIFKTTSRNLARLEKTVLKEHPYDTPEFLVLPISAGSRRYLNWLDESTA